MLLNKDLLPNPKMKKMKNISAIPCGSTTYGMNLPGKLITPQLAKNFLTLYGITKFTKSH
jgi:hypothetical protein